MEGLDIGRADADGRADEGSYEGSFRSDTASVRSAGSTGGGGGGGSKGGASEEDGGASELSEDEGSVITMLLRNLIGGFWSAIDGALVGLDPTTSALRRALPPIARASHHPEPIAHKSCETHIRGCFSRYSYRYR